MPGAEDTRSLEAGVLDLIEEVAGPLDLAGFYARLLGALRRVLRSDWASLNDLGPEPDDAAALAIPDIPPDLLAAFARLRHENPLVAHYADRRDGRPYRFSDFITREQLHELDLYREVYQPLRVEHQIAFTLPAAEKRILGVALSREHPDYSDHERDLLDRSRPLLIELYRNAIEYERVRNPLGQGAPSVASRLRRAGLTRRQAEVISLLATGLSHAQIAERLGLSNRTVSKHTELAYRALGVSSQTEAIDRALRLLDAP